MPIYEYRCEACGASFDRLVSFSAENADIECPECHSRDCRKALSSFFSLSRGGGAAASQCAPTGG
jgi:putative FmdB family regulatory protein